MKNIIISSDMGVTGKSLAVAYLRKTRGYASHVVLGHGERLFEKLLGSGTIIECQTIARAKEAFLEIGGPVAWLHIVSPGGLAEGATARRAVVVENPKTLDGFYANIETALKKVEI